MLYMQQNKTFLDSIVISISACHTICKQSLTCIVLQHVVAIADTARLGKTCAAIFRQRLSSVLYWLILVESCFRKATIATGKPTATGTRIISLTRTGAAAVVLTPRSTKGVEEATRFWLTWTTAAVATGVCRIELLVLVHWYITRLLWHHLRIPHVVTASEGWIRRVMYGPMRR